VLPCPDDFSCGPIASLDPSVRLAWWEEQPTSWGPPEEPGEFATFWQRLDTSDGELVLWFGQRSASDFTLFHVLADRLSDKRFFVVDVTGPKSGAVTHLDTTQLRKLVGTERELDPVERAVLSSRWQVLVQENAPFRVVTETGLESAPETYFDQTLLNAASTTWKGLSRVVGEALGSERAHGQVGDLTLLARAVTLVEQHKLLADGDPRDMRSCKVRLPDLAN